MKKDSHLCSPETDGFKVRARRSNTIENQQRANKKEENKSSNKFAEKQKTSHLCSPKQKGSPKRNAGSEK